MEYYQIWIACEDFHRHGGYLKAKSTKDAYTKARKKHVGENLHVGQVFFKITEKQSNGTWQIVEKLSCNHPKARRLIKKFRLLDPCNSFYINPEFTKMYSI